MGHVPLKRTETGAVQIDAVRRRVEKLERRYRLGDAIQERKMFADRTALDGNLPDEAILVVNDSTVKWAIAPDLRDHYLVYVFAYVSEPSASDVEITIRNETQSIDLVTVVIPGGEKTSTCDFEEMAVPDDTPVDCADEIFAIVSDEGDGLAEGLFASLCWRPATPIE